MKKTIKNPFAHFRIATAMAFTLILLVVLVLFIYGKKNSFIIINGSYNAGLDYFFQYVTVLGDGLIYIPIVLYCILFNKKYLVPVVAGIIICTFLTHFLKRVVFPNELRPINLELENVIIRRINGVPLHRMHSFPSGHTSTAFTMALLLANIMKKKIWVFLLPVIAFFVGYSRVYLGQHFVTDVCAGMFIGIVSAYLSLLIYRNYLNKIKSKELL
jgi:membrane-associated phospholipid phosphatase